MKNQFLLVIVLLFLNLSAFAQNQNPITVHEWGTFTSRYTDIGKAYLTLQSTIDEPVPNFVHNLNFNTEFRFLLNAKGEYFYRNTPVNLRGVTIKMETPVLYFYSKKEVKNLEVNVSFPDGSISEFYPLPIKWEDTAYVRSKVKFEFNDVVEEPNLYFADYNGFAKWKINILAPDNASKPSQPDEAVPNIWQTPRQTQSNMIEANGEIEKYIFYRGLAGFENPVIPYYTSSGNLLVENRRGETIPYALVYERSKEGKRYIWGVNPIRNDFTDIFFKNRVEISDSQWENSYRPEFIKALTNAGLYKDEAEAMLNTWQQSYFEKAGLRIFWIVPRQFTDVILPISFSQPIASLKRVMVGRTEIDDFNPKNTNNYYADIPKTSLKTIMLKQTQGFAVYPNPTNSQIFIKSDFTNTQQVNLRIIDFLGRVVYASEFEIRPDISNPIPCSGLSKGIYYLSISNEAVSKNLKFMVK